MKNIFFIIGLFSLLMSVNAQNQDSANLKLNLNVRMDIVSRFAWRGKIYSDVPNLQPYGTISYGSFSLMNCYSYSTNKNYAEIDFFLTWQPNRFGVTLADYCALPEPANGFNYYNYNKHALGLDLFYTYSNIASMFFFGMD